VIIPEIRRRPRRGSDLLAEETLEEARRNSTVPVVMSTADGPSDALKH